MLGPLSGHLQVGLRSLFEMPLNAFVESQAACERIINTPAPVIYVIQVQTSKTNSGPYRFACEPCWDENQTKTANSLHEPTRIVSLIFQDFDV